ncbi:hypothetical protein [Streptomyces melanogenes]|uniref:hypothetical protein n=1 Tax=Streptomyces melanogenes TaxID=67326 RepID=UPI00167E6461|nr:hypothetical protein [Streptomyces melanogenes]GGP90792.1 hypothetical protein GCM10010278_81410 [Streptomyces melanogenes]
MADAVDPGTDLPDGLHTNDLGQRRWPSWTNSSGVVTRVSPTSGLNAVAPYVGGGVSTVLTVGPVFR